ncbi:hypothetical protein A3Q32_09700 [Alcanivorax sp. KX64203]|nr:hypothetical protein A3Q32_09700 [Alcanivorax sp. KX64203]
MEVDVGSGGFLFPVDGEVASQDVLCLILFTKKKHLQVHDLIGGFPRIGNVVVVEQWGDGGIAVQSIQIQPWGTIRTAAHRQYRSQAKARGPEQISVDTHEYILCSFIGMVIPPCLVKV